MLVKFCGLTRAGDIDIAADLGVDAIGLVLWPRSPRAISMEAARDLIRRVPRAILPVGVFVAPTRDEVMRAVDAGIRVAQIHGASSVSEYGPLCDIWQAASLSPTGELEPEVAEEVTVLLDAHDPVRVGGTGQTIDWQRASTIAARRRVILAGGLTADNVGEAIQLVRPHGIDVSSGIEERPGIKSEQKMRAFMNAIRRAGTVAVHGVTRE